MSVRGTVADVFTDIAKKQNRRVAALSDDVQLIDLGLDSLCLAIVVARLEGELGTDPSGSDYGVGIPATFGEFVALCENVAA
jgi:acyl carrier protein